MSAPATSGGRQLATLRRRALVRENWQLGVGSVLASITPPAFIGMLNGLDVVIGVLLLVTPPAATVIGVILIMPSLRAAAYQVRLLAVVLGVAALWGSQLAFAMGVYTVAPYPMINAPALYAIWGGSAALGALCGSIVGGLMPKWILSDFELESRGVVCPDCGYSLAGLMGGVCPECGRAIASRVERPEGADGA